MKKMVFDSEKVKKALDQTRIDFGVDFPTINDAELDAESKDYAWGWFFALCGHDRSKVETLGTIKNNKVAVDGWYDCRQHYGIIEE